MDTDTLRFLLLLLSAILTGTGCTTESVARPRQLTGAVMMPSCLFLCIVNITAEDYTKPSNTLLLPGERL